jgi:hypothetical protein
MQLPDDWKLVIGSQVIAKDDIYSDDDELCVNKGEIGTVLGRSRMNDKLLNKTCYEVSFTRGVTDVFPTEVMPFNLNYKVRLETKTPI